MEIVEKISALVLEYGNKLGSYLIPLLILLPILLIPFSRYSFSVFKFVFPVIGAVVGYFAGAKLITSFVEKYFTGYKFIKPEHVAGAACALLLLLICFKTRKTAIIAIGAVVGYFVVGKWIINALNKNGFTHEVLTNTPDDKRTIFYFIICAFCAIVAMYLFYNFFNVIYIYATSIASLTAAIAIPAIFIFEKVTVPEATLVICIGVGAFIGLIVGIIQHSRNKYFYYY